MKLEQFKQLHNLMAYSANFKNTFIIGCRFEYWQENTKTGTINIFNAFEVEDQPGSGRIVETFQVLFYRFGNERIESVNVIKADNGNIVYFLNL